MKDIDFHIPSTKSFEEVKEAIYSFPNPTGVSKCYVSHNNVSQNVISFRRNQSKFHQFFVIYHEKKQEYVLIIRLENLVMYNRVGALLALVVACLGAAVTHEFIAFLFLLTPAIFLFVRSFFAEKMTKKWMNIEVEQLRDLII
jgi:hypothetical protein